MLVRRGFSLKWHSRLAELAGATKTKTSELLGSLPQVCFYSHLSRRGQLLPAEHIEEIRGCRGA